MTHTVACPASQMMIWSAYLETSVESGELVKRVIPDRVWITIVVVGMAFLSMMTAALSVITKL